MGLPERISDIVIDVKGYHKDLLSYLPRIPFKESRQRGVESVRIIKPEYLVPILAWAYGPKAWGSRNARYWAAEKWDYLHPNQAQKRVWPPEVRQTHEDLRTILGWVYSPGMRGHFDPPIEVPKDWHNKDKVDHAVAELAKYYFNVGEPRKITPLLTVDLERKPVAVMTIRWKGDPYNPAGRIAGLERIIVAPERQGQGIGRRFLATVLEHAFTKGYGGQGATEVRLWIMQDEVAGDWRANWYFFRSFGFQVVPRSPHWPEYAQQRGISTNRGDAILLHLTRELWEQSKTREDPRFKPYVIIN